jgi:hypothetical protein
VAGHVADDGRLALLRHSAGPLGRDLVRGCSFLANEGQQLVELAAEEEGGAAGDGCGGGADAGHAECCAVEDELREALHEEAGHHAAADHLEQQLGKHFGEKRAHADGDVDGRL